MKRHINKKRGFTLIEMLVVIAIIALLTGIIITNLSGARAKARDSQRISDMGNLQIALELYFDRCKHYPTALDVSDATKCTNTGTASINLGSYISTIPTPPASPLNQTSYDYMINDLAVPTDYFLHVTLENQNDAVKNAISVAPSGYYWNGVGTTSICSNDPVAREYCLGPK